MRRRSSTPTLTRNPRSVPAFQVELDDLSAACTRLWDLDYARLAPGMDYQLDLQQGKKPYYEGDCAEGPLFKWVSPDVLQRPEWAAFIALLDNYEAAAGKAERVTSEERTEEVGVGICISFMPSVPEQSQPTTEVSFRSVT